MELLSNDINNTRTLVAKFFTKRRTNMEAIHHTLRSMQRAGSSFEIHVLRANTILTIFQDEADINRILMQGSQSFDKYLIGLYKLGEEAMVDDANFDKASFWVKTHGLQSRRMCKENVEVIGNTLGRVKHVEELNIDDCCW